MPVLPFIFAAETGSAATDTNSVSATNKAMILAEALFNLII